MRHQNRPEVPKPLRDEDIQPPPPKLPEIRPTGGTKPPSDDE